jgi:hypothetical protein
MRKSVVLVNDRMQKGYRYRLTAAVGRNFDPEFTPDLSPQEMLRLGIFCGKYMTDCRKEFPKSWFARAKLATGRRDCSLNFFGVDASQPCRNGAPRDGFVRTIRAVGSNGIAATTLAGARRTKIAARSDAGRPCADTCGRFSVTVNRAICSAAADSAKPSCIGHLTAAKFDPGALFCGQAIPRIAINFSNKHQG